MRFMAARFRRLTYIGLMLAVVIAPGVVSQATLGLRASTESVLLNPTVVDNLNGHNRASTFQSTLITVTLQGPQPDVVSIVPGDSVTWKNMSGVTQTLRISQEYRVNMPVVMRPSTDVATHVSRAHTPVEGVLLSTQRAFVERVLGVGESFSYTFITPGSFAFSVANHSGNVIVLPDNTPTPTSIPTSMATLSASPSASQTDAPPTPTVTATDTPPTPTNTSQPISTPTSTQTLTPTKPLPTATATGTSPTPTNTSLPISTPTSTPTVTPTPELGGNTVLVAQGSVWRFLDNDSNQVTTWQSASFDDMAWTSGPAPLGYGDPMSTTVNSGPINNRYITTYLRKTFGVTDPSRYATLILQLRRDDGAVIYLNGIEVVRSNMPAGTVTYQTLASATVDGANETTFFSYTLSSSALAAGNNTLAVEIHQRAINSSDIGFDLKLDAMPNAGNATPTPTPISTVAPAFAIAAAGDIAKCSGLANTYDTANLIKGMPDVQVLALGDLAYNSGTDAEFQNCYDPTWGQFKNRTRPSPGNHEYNTAGAAGYFHYWGVPEYYAWDFGSWHFVSLDSEIDYSANSVQMNWLRADLAASTARCKLAYWHRPRFSSGTSHGSDASLSSIWSMLQTYNATLVLVGHEHNYERFGPQDAGGNATSTGIREFVVGTGGADSYSFRSTPVANSEFRLTNIYGILKLDLLPTSYRWQFIATDGTVKDSGIGSCN